MSRVPLQPLPHAQSGMSLVEVITGVAICILLIGGALTGVASHQSQRRIHGERMLAMAACRSTIETLRNLPIAALPSYHGRGFDVRGANGEAKGLSAVAGDADGLAGEIEVTVDRSTGAVLLYRVTTRVRWRGVTPRGLLTMSILLGERR